jgi:dTDP-4-amino-4,6-dideoxygalactose transaminase
MQLQSPQVRFKINSTAYDYISAFRWLFSGAYPNYDATQQLEKKLCAHLGASAAVAMPQARVGIFLAILAITKPGQEIILSPNTIADVINMVICAGAKPVFCDIDPATGNIDPELVEGLVTPNTAGIMATHLYGLVAPMKRLKEIASQYNLILIEDAAQAFGACVGQQYAGTLGDIGIYSFGMAKNITAFFGGMLVTSNKEIEKKVRKQLLSFPLMSKKKLRNKIISCFIKDIASIDLIFSNFLFKIFKYGYRSNKKFITRLIEAESDLSRKYFFPESYKKQMTAFQAHLILTKLEKEEIDFQHRLHCAKIYYEGLKDIPELLIPPMREDKSHVYNYYPIGYKERSKLRDYLLQNNRDVALQHIKNTADLPAFADYHRDCPNSREWANQTIMMPNYPKYRFSEVEKNVKAIRHFVGK